jgi:hypothetical protein
MFYIVRPGKTNKMEIDGCAVWSGGQGAAGSGRPICSRAGIKVGIMAARISFRAVPGEGSTGGAVYV